MLPNAVRLKISGGGQMCVSDELTPPETLNSRSFVKCFRPSPSERGSWVPAKTQRPQTCHAELVSASSHRRITRVFKTPPAEAQHWPDPEPSCIGLFGLAQPKYSALFCFRKMVASFGCLLLRAGFASLTRRPSENPPG